MSSTNGALPVNHPLYAEIVQFLYHEAALLDARRFAEWINLMTEDIRYCVPLRPAEKRNLDASPTGLHWFDDDLETLRFRVSRLATDFAHSENPPSQTRHMITNVRVWGTSTSKEFDVAANLLVHRYQGSQSTPDVFCGERRDLLRKTNGEWRLANRTVNLDQSVMSAGSLGIFL